MRRKIFVLVALMAFIFSYNVEAGLVGNYVPFQCYVERQIDTYNNPGDGRRAGWISANVDLIRVTQVRSDGWAYGDYPGANGKRVSRWFRLSDICADPNYSNRSANVKGAQQVFRTSSSGNTIGSVSNNESVIVLADNGNRAQILYRLDNGTGYKIGWVPSSTVADNRSVNPAPNNMNHNPQGTVEQANSPAPNTLHVRGKAYDLDNARASTRLHVYVGGGAGSGAPSYEIRTDARSGLFDDTRTVERTGRQHVYIYALNDYGAGENKEIWNGYVDIQGQAVPAKLQSLINTYKDTVWRNHTYLPNVRECKEFASFIFDKMYGVGYIGGGSTSDNPQNYLINLSNPARVALRDYKTNLTAESARELFRNAQSGDFVQIRRRHGGAHSGIFVERTSNGIVLFEANEDSRNSIRTNTYSYSDLANRNFAMSLYYAK